MGIKTICSSNNTIINTFTIIQYINEGLCAGFLVLLYMFGMIVLIVIKKKQRRDARLREQFLNLPLPTGLGYKSSRILGLDNQLEKNKLAGFNDDVRYSIKTKSFSQIQPKLSRRDEQLESESKVEEKIYDITKVCILPMSFTYTSCCKKKIQELHFYDAFSSVM